MSFGVHKLLGHTHTVRRTVQRTRASTVLPPATRNERIWMETFIDEQFDRIYAYWVSADTGTHALYVQPLVLGREHVYVCVWDPEVFHSIVFDILQVK